MSIASGPLYWRLHSVGCFLSCLFTPRTFHRPFKRASTTGGTCQPSLKSSSHPPPPCPHARYCPTLTRENVLAPARPRLKCSFSPMARPPPVGITGHAGKACGWSGGCWDGARPWKQRETERGGAKREGGAKKPSLAGVKNNMKSTRRAQVE